MEIKKKYLIGHKKYNRETIKNLTTFISNFIEKGYVIKEYYNFILNENEDRISFTSLDELNEIITKEKSIKKFNIQLRKDKQEFVLANTWQFAGWEIETITTTYDENLVMNNLLGEYLPLLKLKGKFMYHIYDSTSTIYIILGLVSTIYNIVVKNPNIYIILCILLIFLLNVGVSIAGAFLIPFKDNNKVTKKIYSVIKYVLGIIVAAIIGALINKWFIQ